MATAQLGAVLRHIRGLTAGPPNNHLADDDLLDAFLIRHDRSAFEEILRRHGPLVLSVCRRVLGGLHDAEDAFQATFLFLAQRGRSIRKRKSLASWLHGVARRMATNARRSAARRSRHERQYRTASSNDPAWQAAWHEVQSILDEEIQRLPQAAREPFLSCCLEHRSCAEVAVQLGLQEPAVRTRICRARKLLEQRLARRGVSLTLLSAALTVSADRATAEVAPILLKATSKAAAHLASTKGTTNGMVSAKVIALLKKANQAMALTKLKITLAVLLGTILLGGTALVYGRGLLAEPGDERPGELAAPRLQAKGAQASTQTNPQSGRRTDLQGDPLPDEALVRLGTTRFRPGEAVSFLRFTPDGTKLVTQSDSGLRVWDAATGRELRRFGPVAGVGTEAADMSADGKLALTADLDQHGTLRLWDVNTGRQLRECGNAVGFCPVCLSPDGKSIAAPGPAGGIDLRDATSGEQQHTLKGHGNSCAGFSTDSKTLITGGADKTIRLWDVSTGQEIRHIDCPEAVSSVTFSPNGKLLASVGYIESSPAPGITARLPGNRAHIWDAATGKELRQLTVEAKPERSGTLVGFAALAFTPDSKTLVTVNHDRVLRVWDATEGKELRAFPGCSTNIHALAVAPDGKSAAFVNAGTTLRIIDLATGKDRVPLPGHLGGVNAAAVARDGHTILTAGIYDSIYIWDTATGKQVRSLGGDRLWTSTLALAPDGRLLYSLSSYGKLLVWDTTTGKVQQRLAGEYDGSKVGITAVSGDGKLLAAMSKNGIVLIEAASGKPIRTAAGLEGRSCHGAGFARDGRALVVWTGDQDIFILDVATGKVLKRYPFAGDDEKRLSYAAALSPDGRLLAFGSQRRFISVLDVATGEEVRRFEKLADGVSSLAFSHDGRALAWGGWKDPTIHLIELSSRQERHHLTGHQGRILALNFSHDGKLLVSGGNDATALVWDLVGPKAGDKDLSSQEFASLWKGLGEADAPKAYLAVRRLARSAAAVKFLGTQVQPVAVPDEKRVAKLMADLDSDEFDIRNKATKELERLGDQVAEACRKALADRPSPEMRRRLQELLDKQTSEAQQPSAERVQLSRALEALELAGTDPARELLAKLAQGAPGAWLSEEAKSGRERLDRRGRATP
jgi:RNA polymerase sigma factor (sigma-70 family)